MKKSFLLLLFGIFAYSLQAQQLPVYGQFYLNPYMYNPSFVGNSRYTEIYVSHRQQWVGIEGAPVTSSLSIHLPTKGKVAYGFNLYSDKRGMLSTTSTLFTVGYTAHLSEDQFLKAGLSTGIGMNAIRMAEVHNPNDPALSNFTNGNLFLDGNIGINYQYKQLNIGVSLPKIFQRSMVYTNNRNEIQVKRLDHFLITAGYKFQFANGGVAFEPQLLYQFAKGFPHQYEALGIVYLRDRLWFGGSYRQHYGPTAFIGFKISDLLRFGYGYEIGTMQQTAFTNSTHELTLNLRFGQKKESTRKNTSRPLPSIPSKTTHAQPAKSSNDSSNVSILSKKVSAERVDSIKLQNNKEIFSTSAQPIVQADQANPTGVLEERIAEQKGQNYLELTKGHYVVVSAFRIFDNALKYHENLSDRFSSCKYGYSSKTLFYYSYVMYTQDINRARYERNKLRRMKGFENTWVLTIE